MSVRPTVADGVTGVTNAEPPTSHAPSRISSGKMAAMPILALETSTELGTCALLLGDQCLERTCPPGRPHSETLLPLIRALLADAGLTFSQLEGIAFGVGPGAFTGLRVACGVAQGLAVAADLPLVPVCSLENLAEQSGRDAVLPILDARMGEVYVAAYQRQAGGYVPLTDIQVVAPAALPVPAGAGWQAIGNALGVYPVLGERLSAAGIAHATEITLPLAGVAARLARPRLLAGQGIDAALAAPLYIRDKVAKTVAERLSEGGRA